MISETYERKLLPQELSVGVLNLIPKASKDSRRLKNLRPITLLCTDLKIIEKAIANRIEPILCQLVNKDQRGFMKNRRISVNIRKILDLMMFTDLYDIAGEIMSLDFMKCFNKIETCAILGSMEFFNISKYLTELVKLMYSSFYARIQNNGNFSEKIHIQKGVHQGSPASSVLFLLCAEILAISLRNNSDI